MKILRVLILAWLILLAPLPLITGGEKRTVRCRVTGYCPGACCCGTSADGLTSIGDDAYVLDGVAADPKRLPYRTRLRIPGVGVREVDDTGGAMKRGKVLRLDLRFATHKEAREWGVQWLDVEILP